MTEGEDALVSLLARCGRMMEVDTQIVDMLSMQREVLLGMLGRMVEDAPAAVREAYQETADQMLKTTVMLAERKEKAEQFVKLVREAVKTAEEADMEVEQKTSFRLFGGAVVVLADTEEFASDERNEKIVAAMGEAWQHVTEIAKSELWNAAVEAGLSEEEADRLVFVNAQ